LEVDYIEEVLFISEEWVERFKEKLNSSPEYRDAARK